jgi:hypothetical protein
MEAMRVLKKMTSHLKDPIDREADEILKKFIRKSKMAWQNLLRKRKELTPVSHKFLALFNEIEKI